MPPEFDLEKAREVAAKTGTIPCASKAVFVAALDEIERQAKQIETLKSDIEQLTALVAAKDVDIVFVERRE